MTAGCPNRQRRHTPSSWTTPNPDTTLLGLYFQQPARGENGWLPTLGKMLRSTLMYPSLFSRAVVFVGSVPRATMQRLAVLLPGMNYDVCVLTGDYRAATFGSFDAALEGLAQVRARLRGAVYGVLGNYDTIRMVPGLEEIGIRMLLNECEPISCDDQRIYLAGIDDAHYYRADNIEKVASEIPHDGFSILLSHTPEIYRQ